MPADFINFLDAIQDIKFGFQQFESHFTIQEKETFTKLVAFEESLRNVANQDSIKIEVDPDFEDAAANVVEKLIRVTKDESKRLMAKGQRLRKENNALKKKIHLNKLLQKIKIESKDKQIEELKQRYYELQKQLESMG